MAEQKPGGATGRKDPDVQFSFYVEVDGIRCARFREAQGLEWRADPVQFHEGGNHRHKVSLVGQGAFTPLTLKKGFFAASSEFFDWMSAIMDAGQSQVKRATISVVIQNAAGDEIGRYNLFGAFMTRYAGPAFNAMDSAIAVEEIEIAYDDFEYKPAKGGPGGE